MSSPRVSVVIPVYNGANYLRLAVESALAQTYRNIEVIVVNDGSTDGGRTRDIAVEFGRRIRYFEQPNGGVGSALNAGIREMSGDYFSWLSHDDLYRADKVEAQMDYLADRGWPVAVLYSDFDIIDGSGRVVRRVKLRNTDPADIALHLLAGFPVQGCSTLVPRRCFDEDGLFDESLKTVQDYEMWFRLARRHPFLHLAKPLISVRHHSDQASLTLAPTATREQEALYTRLVTTTPPAALSGGRRGDLGLSVLFLAVAGRLKTVKGLTSASDAAIELALQHARSLVWPLRAAIGLAAKAVPRWRRRYTVLYWRQRLKKLEGFLRRRVFGSTRPVVWTE